MGSRSIGLINGGSGTPSPGLLSVECFWLQVIKTWQAQTLWECVIPQEKQGSESTLQGGSIQHPDNIIRGRVVPASSLPPSALAPSSGWRGERSGGSRVGSGHSSTW